MVGFLQSVSLNLVECAPSKEFCPRLVCWQYQDTIMEGFVYNSQKLGLYFTSLSEKSFPRQLNQEGKHHTITIN